MMGSDGKFHGDPINGVRAEEYFAHLADERGYDVEESTVSEDRKDHIDFYLTMNGVRRSVDVKARKNVGRYSGDEYTWIELLNVNGHTGSLYGKADIIAFERSRDFILVERSGFAQWVTSRVDMDAVVESGGDALYKCYHRQGDKSILTIIRFDDIPLRVSKKYWKKDLTP